MDGENRRVMRQTLGGLNPVGAMAIWNGYQLEADS
jgi:hypothetical protein